MSQHPGWLRVFEGQEPTEPYRLLNPTPGAFVRQVWIDPTLDPDCMSILIDGERRVFRVHDDGTWTEVAP